MTDILYFHKVDGVYVLDTDPKETEWSLGYLSADEMLGLRISKVAYDMAMELDRKIMGNDVDDSLSLSDGIDLD